jgi:hypothetical protein
MPVSVIFIDMTDYIKKYIFVVSDIFERYNSNEA